MTIGQNGLQLPLVGNVLGTATGVVGPLLGGTGLGAVLPPLLGGGTGSGSGSTTIPVAGDLLGAVDGILGGLTGGGLGGGSGSTGGGNLVVGNLINTRVLDGLINLELLNDKTILDLSLLDKDKNGTGLVDLSLLDPDGDGLINIGLLDGAIDVSIIDPDGNGLIDIDILDLIDIDIDGPGDDVDGGDGPDNGGPGGSTDPKDYARVVIGTEGRDSVVIGSDKTYVDGLGAVDTASYGVDSEGFAYQTSANGVFVSQGNKVDYLQNVERVKFSDGTLVLDTDAGENAGMAYRIYQAAFDRTPDVAGLKFWIDRIDGGQSLGKVAADFLFSNEFRQTYGNLTNSQYVDELYDNVLNRDGETAGLNFWVNQLNSGAKDRAEVLANFSESAENVQLVGAAIHDGFFLA